jgi:putative intracellular protease/amidase
MILMLLPRADYDPTESGVPWAALRDAGFDVAFATPDGAPAFADERLVDRGFGPLSPVLMTRRPDLERYGRMSSDPAFLSPLAYADVQVDGVDALVIPGGHAPGMRTMLESPIAQDIARAVFTAGKPVGAVCHGVLLLARTIDPTTSRSVLHGRRTTALLALMELGAWAVTRPWLGGYYRTYPQTVQAEVTAALASRSDFAVGPLLSRRDSADAPQRGFAVRDGVYVSARWPGDCHRFAAELVDVVRAAVPAVRARAASGPVAADV